MESAFKKRKRERDEKIYSTYRSFIEQGMLVTDAVIKTRARYHISSPSTIYNIKKRFETAKNEEVQ